MVVPNKSWFRSFPRCGKVRVSQKHDGKGIQRRMRSAILWSDLSLPLRSHKKPPMGAEFVFFVPPRPSLKEIFGNYVLNK